MPWPMLPNTVSNGLSSPATIPGSSTLQVRAGGEGDRELEERTRGGVAGRRRLGGLGVPWARGLEKGSELVGRVREEPRG